VVNLIDDERTTLRVLVRKGTVAARKLTRAHILFQADETVSDQSIADALHVGRATVERVRKRFVEGGLEAALTERPRPGGKRMLDGKTEATLVAWACSTPPDDRKQWSMQLLADKLIELKRVETISDETVRRTLKQPIGSLGLRKHGAFRRSAPSSSGVWKLCSTCMPRNMIPSTRWFASTRRPINW
jgi:transposase